VVAPHMSGHPVVLPWRVTSLHCPNQMGVLSWRRTNRVVAAPSRVRGCEVRYHPMSLCGRLDVGPSYTWPQCAGLSAPTPPLALHESMTVKRQRRGGVATHASS